MKPITFLSLIMLFSIYSCNQRSERISQNKKKEEPKALQDNSKDISFISKRSPDNLVEELYNDMVQKHADLKKLENQKSHFNAGYADSLEDFKNYDVKSNNYYSSALLIVNDVKDTVLRERLRTLLSDSKKNYATKTARYTSLIKKIEADQLTANDYYQTLKIVTTLPVMEEYQDDNLSSGKSIESIAGESDKLNHFTQKLALKYQDKAVKEKIKLY